MEMRARTQKGCFSIRTGSEGPRHDPYSYQELVIDRKGRRRVVYHAGLGEYIMVGSRKVEPPRYRSVQSWAQRDKLQSRWLQRRFEKLVGVTTLVAERAIHRANSRCKKCSAGLVEESGYPGETLYVCPHCHVIGGSSFDRSAIE